MLDEVLFMQVRLFRMFLEQAHIAPFGSRSGV